MPGSEQTLRKTYRLATSIQVGKFTVGVVDTSVYTDGFTLSASANAAKPVGIAQDSVIPFSNNDYSGGKYITASGASWSASSTPASPIGRALSFGVNGIFRAIAASAITRGDRLNQAATTTINSVSMMGAVKTVSETTGNTIYEIGEALDGATNAGDVVRVRLTLAYYKI